MQSLPECHIISHNPDSVEVVRKAYNLYQPGRIDESVDRLQEWIRAQPHFNKKNFTRDFLEMFIINNKGSVEKAKQKLERHCAIKTFGEKFFTTSVRAINLKELENLYTAALPKLTKDHHRVYFLRNTMEYYGPNIIKNYCIQSIFFLEAMLKYNYSMGVIVVFDWRKADLFKMLPFIAQEDCHFCLQIFLKAYQMRIKNVHIIFSNKTMILDTLLSTVKSIISSKVLSRIMVHKDLESLYKYIDKDILPSDYGGKEKPLMELAADWNKFLSNDEFVEYCDEIFKATIDTTKKPKAEFNDLFYGMAGTFRTLQID